MCQDFKRKGIKGVIVLELTTRRDPEGCRAESHRHVGAFLPLCSSLCLCSVGGDLGCWRQEEEARMDMGESPGKNYMFSVIVSVTCLLWEMIKT